MLCFNNTTEKNIDKYHECKKNFCKLIENEENISILSGILVLTHIIKCWNMGDSILKQMLLHVFSILLKAIIDNVKYKEK